MSYASITDYTRKISSLMSLLESIVFSDSCEVRNYLYWAS